MNDDNNKKLSLAENFAKRTISENSMNHGKLRQSITFINAVGDADSTFFKNIQSIHVRKNNTLLRVFLTHAVVDITTNDAHELLQIIYQKKYHEYEAGGEYEGAEITDMVLHDVSNHQTIKK